MQEISNSVRQRLKARPEPQEHPDPDVLTAYVEQVLPAAGRTEVISHLAQCSYCREVVALSLSQAQPEPQVSSQPAPAHRPFWVPAFRWGAAFAMLAVAGTLIVERPWKTPPQPAQSLQTEPAQPSQPASPASPVLTSSENHASQNLATAGPASRGGSPVVESHAPAVTRSRPSANTGPETATVSSPPPVRDQAGIVATEPAKSRPQEAARVAASRPAPAPQQPQDSYSYQNSGTGYVNTNVLREGPSDASVTNNFANNNGTVLPSAPAPQGARGQSNAKPFPAIGLGELPDRTMDLTVVAPKTDQPSDSPSGDTTVAKSRGFLKSKIDVAANVAKKVFTGQGSGAAGDVNSFSARSLAGPAPGLADTTEEKTPAAPQSHWRISPDGILMKSSDHTRWHEAYPQDSNLQFKVVLPKGEQIWAGGNNGTLIHSWNAGVNWETLKVPDSGDITAITVDDGWQVKTSNGQTFVSTDRGKTWVPLQAEPH